MKSFHTMIKVLEGLFFPVVAAVLVVWLRAWSYSQFWVFAVAAIGLAFLLNYISKRATWLWIILFLFLPLLGLIYALLHLNHYLLVDAVIQIAVMELIETYKNFNPHKSIS